MEELFQEQLSVYPRTVRHECIDYERWIIMIRSEPGFVKENWKSMLKADCKKIERFLFPIFTATLPDSWIRHLSILNREILREICRQLSETLGIHECYDYYNSCCRRFRFISKY